MEIRLKLQGYEDKKDDHWTEISDHLFLPTARYLILGIMLRYRIG